MKNFIHNLLFQHYGCPGPSEDRENIPISLSMHWNSP
jgi:hypothetical protein